MCTNKSSPSKSSSSSSPNHQPRSASSTTGGRAATMAIDQPPVCESPLFGVRRQLNLSNRNLAERLPQQHSATGDRGQRLGNAADEEEMAALSSVPQQISRQQIHYAFSIMDSNRDGMIDVRELSQMLSNLGVPIDEAILSHIMSSVSKKGDRKISEEEFVQWISLVIQVEEQQTTQQSASSKSSSSNELRTSRPEARSSLAGKQQSYSSRSHSPSAKSRVPKTSTSGSCLLAQTDDIVPRNRRGSGSGLALMRSLSGSSLAAAAKSHQQQLSSSPVPDESRQQNDNIGRRRPSSQSAETVATATTTTSTCDQDLEARNDLRAAFCVFDLDGDGYITLDEVREGMKLLGESWSPNELRQFFNKCSSSSSSTSNSSAASLDLSKQRISIDEFVRLLM